MSPEAISKGLSGSVSIPTRLAGDGSAVRKGCTKRALLRRVSKTSRKWNWSFLITQKTPSSQSLEVAKSRANMPALHWIHVWFPQSEARFLNTGVNGVTKQVTIPLPEPIHVGQHTFEMSEGSLGGGLETRSLAYG